MYCKYGAIQTYTIIAAWFWPPLHESTEGDTIYPTAVISDIYERTATTFQPKSSSIACRQLLQYMLHAR